MPPTDLPPRFRRVHEVARRFVAADLAMIKLRRTKQGRANIPDAVWRER